MAINPCGKNFLPLLELTSTLHTPQTCNRSLSPNPIRFRRRRCLRKIGELTLRVGKEAVTFNLDQTSRYSSNYDDNSVNRIDVIDMACEEYSQEVLGFSNVIAKRTIPGPAFLALEDDQHHRS
ncbi:hypothetical protein Tco_0246685 [Tanacetum coccineum]